MMNEGLRNSIAATVDAAHENDKYYVSVERRDVESLGRVHYAVKDDGSESLALLSPDDVAILINTSQTSGLNTHIEQMRSSSLRSAVVRDCAGMEEQLPAWLDAGSTAPGGESVPEPVSDGPVLDPFPSCDLILPPETVAGICNVAATVARPTSFEQEGENCNRQYRIPGQGGGIVFMVSNYRNYRTASSSVTAGSVADGDFAKDVSMLPNLGQGGERYLHDVTNPTYTVRFACMARWSRSRIRTRRGTVQMHCTAWISTSCRRLAKPSIEISRSWRSEECCSDAV